MATVKDEMTCREPVDFVGFSKEQLQQSHTEVCPDRIRLVGKTMLAFETTAGCRRIAHMPAIDSKSLGEK